MADDLKSNRLFRDLVDRVRRLEVATPLYSASVTEGRLRFIGGLLRVDSGGRVEIVGTLQIEGTTDITGPTTVTGTFTVEGPWSLDGDGDITGDVGLTGTLSVAGSGEINVGTAMKLDPSEDGGAVVFGNGARLAGTSGGAVLSLGDDTPWIGINPSTAWIGYGAAAVEVSGAGIRFYGLPTKSGTGLPVGMIWQDTDATIYRILS